MSGEEQTAPAAEGEEEAAPVAAVKELKPFEPSLRPLTEAETQDLLQKLAPYTGRNAVRLMWSERDDEAKPRSTKGFGIDDSTNTVYYDTYEAIYTGMEPSPVRSVAVGKRSNRSLTLADTVIPLLEKSATYKVTIAPAEGASYNLVTAFGSTSVQGSVKDITALAPSSTYALVYDAATKAAIGFGAITHNTDWTQDVEKQGALVDCMQMTWASSFLGNVAYKAELEKLQKALKDGGKQKILDGTSPTVRIWPDLHDRKVVTKKPIVFETGDSVLSEDGKKVVEQLARMITTLDEVISAEGIALDLKYKVSCAMEKLEAFDEDDTEEDRQEALAEAEERCIARAQAVVAVLNEAGMAEGVAIAAKGGTGAPGCATITVVD